MTDVDDYFDHLEAALKSRAAAAPRVPPAEPSLLAEAFHAILALEEGEPGAKPVRLVLGNADPRFSEAFLDDLARRVAERLKNERSG
jgi:hypothetical protein